MDLLEKPISSPPSPSICPAWNFFSTSWASNSKQKSTDNGKIKREIEAYERIQTNIDENAQKEPQNAEREEG